MMKGLMAMVRSDSVHSDSVHSDPVQGSSAARGSMETGQVQWARGDVPRALQYSLGPSLGAVVEVTVPTEPALKKSTRKAGLSGPSPLVVVLDVSGSMHG